MNVFILLMLLMITGPIQAQVQFNSSSQQYNYSTMTNLEKLNALLNNSGVIDPKMGKLDAYLNVNVVTSELDKRVGNTNKQRFLLEISYILEELYESSFHFSDGQLKVLSDLNDFVTAQLGKVNRNISNVKETRDKVCDRLGVDRSITDEELDMAVAKKVPTLIGERALANEEIVLMFFEYYEYLRNRIAVLSNGKSFIAVHGNLLLNELAIQQDMLSFLISNLCVFSAPELFARKLNGQDITLDLQRLREKPTLRMIESVKVVK